MKSGKFRKRRQYREEKRAMESSFAKRDWLKGLGSNLTLNTT
jgi:hypothetical protein